MPVSLRRLSCFGIVLLDPSLTGIQPGEFGFQPDGGTPGHTVYGEIVGPTVVPDILSLSGKDYVGILSSPGRTTLKTTSGTTGFESWLQPADPATGLQKRRRAGAEPGDQKNSLVLLVRWSLRNQALNLRREA